MVTFPPPPPPPPQSSTSVLSCPCSTKNPETLKTIRVELSGTLSTLNTYVYSSTESRPDCNLYLFSAGSKTVWACSHLPATRSCGKRLNQGRGGGWGERRDRMAIVQLLPLSSLVPAKARGDWLAKSSDTIIIYSFIAIVDKIGQGIAAMSAALHTLIKV